MKITWGNVQKRTAMNTEQIEWRTEGKSIRKGKRQTGRWKFRPNWSTHQFRSRVGKFSPTNEVEKSSKMIIACWMSFLDGPITELSLSHWKPNELTVAWNFASNCSLYYCNSLRCRKSKFWTHLVCHPKANSVSCGHIYDSPLFGRMIYSTELWLWRILNIRIFHVMQHPILSHRG